MCAGEERAGESERGGEGGRERARARERAREDDIHNLARKYIECGGDFGGQRQRRAREREGVGRW